MIDRSIYISYRRSFSYSIALALFHGLRAAGCDVFIDARRVNDRDAVDLNQIEARSHFLVVITPGLIEALQQPDDPMYREIERAVSKRRNVVPLLANGFSFSTTFVMKEIGVLRRYYALPLTPETLAETVTSLESQSLNARIFGAIVPTPPEERDIVQGRIAEAERQPPPTDDELSAEVIYNRALARSRQDYSGKLADFDDVLRLNPHHVYARFDRALTRRRSGDESGAVEDYDAVVSLNPQFHKAYNNRAELYFAHGAYAQALADFEQATALQPNYMMSLAGKALTLHALGQIDEALRLWRSLAVHDERFYDAVWVGRELRLPTAMIDEIHRLSQHLHTTFHAPDD